MGIFDPLNMGNKPRPINRDLSKIQQQIHHAIERVPLFQTGFQALPQTQRQVSLQGVGPTPPSGPALAGSPQTMAEIGGGSPVRDRLVKALQTPNKGWQFGPAGSLARHQMPKLAALSPLKPQITPTSTLRPALSGGIPTHSPSIKPGSEVVNMAGFKLDPIGTIQLPPAPTGTLAPLLDLGATSEVDRLIGLGSGIGLGEGVPNASPIPTTAPAPKPTLAAVGAETTVAPPPPIASLGAVPGQGLIPKAPTAIAAIPPPPEFEAPDRPDTDQGE